MTDFQPTPPPSTPYVPGAVAPQERWNVLSIVGFVLAFFVSIAAIILGFIALSQIKKTGEKGRGLALAAVILGFVGIALGIIYIIVIVAVVASGAAAGAYSSN